MQPCTLLCLLLLLSTMAMAQQPSDTATYIITPTNLEELQAATNRARSAGITGVTFAFEPGEYPSEQTFPTNTLETFRRTVFRSTAAVEDRVGNMSTSILCNQADQTTLLDLLQPAFTSGLQEFIIDGLEITYCPVPTTNGDGYARYLPLSELAQGGTRFIIQNSRMIIRQLINPILDPNLFEIVGPNTILQRHIAMKLYTTQRFGTGTRVVGQCFVTDFEVINTTFVFQSTCSGTVCELLDRGQLLCLGCPEGYLGESCNIATCFGKLGNDSTVCGGNGVCLQPDTCYCRNNYVGRECTCQSLSNSCSNNGGSYDVNCVKSQKNNENSSHTLTVCILAYAILIALVVFFDK